MNLLRRLILSIIPGFLPGILFALHLPATLGQEHVIQAILNHDPRIESYVRSDELRFSRRLGIKYDGVQAKTQIGFEIDQGIIDCLANNSCVYTLSRDTSGSYSRVQFRIAQPAYTKDFYFDGDSIISPITYWCRGWKRIESDHLVFLVHDSTQFNLYVKEKLESFATSMLNLLGVPAEDEKLLRQQKIYYVLCKDEHEIEAMSGFNTRGICTLSYDYVITTFTCHFHELAHLLLNFKLRHIPLYTHPFFQEGFAVAYGGRGGVSASVMYQTGAYLSASGSTDLAQLVSRRDFLDIDASFTYPYSGAYNHFLIGKIGLQKYLSLYRKYSGSEKKMETLVIDTLDLPPRSQWSAFVDSCLNDPVITFATTAGATTSANLDDQAGISIGNERDTIRLRTVMLLSNGNRYPSYSSAVFFQYVHDKDYGGEKYLITADTNEINVWNLYENFIIASYIKPFTLTNTPIPRSGDRFEFTIRKSVFDESLNRFHFQEH